MYNVTLWRVRVTALVKESQQWLWVLLNHMSNSTIQKLLEVSVLVTKQAVPSVVEELQIIVYSVYCSTVSFSAILTA
jgi:hypothetical protein